MSEAFRCDACGQFFEGNPDNYDGSMKVQRWRWLYLPLPFSLPKRQIDFHKEICPECSKKIDDILHIERKNDESD